MSLERFSLIAFDLDGTLIDSRRDIADAANEMLVRCGATPLPEEQIGRMVGDGAAKLVARAFEASRVDRPADALDRFLRIYSSRLTDHTRAYDDIPAVLAALGAGKALAVLTNKPRAATETILERLKLARYFDPALIVCGDGPVPRKPDPAGLRRLMETAGAPPGGTLLVGDSIIDWRTARAAPSAICVARYGFGFESFARERIEPDDFVVDSPAGLLRL